MLSQELKNQVEKVDVLVVGAGPAGMAAAIAAKEGYLRGKLTVEKALMGKAMALTGGRADPEVLSRLVHEALTALAASQK